MATQQTIDMVAELHDFAAWMDKMPVVPGHRRNGDGMWETYQNVVESVIEDNSELCAALDFVQGDEANADGWDSEAAMWRDVAQALEIELTIEG